MSSQDRFIELLSDWLEDQPSSAPDQLLQTVLTDLPRTAQRARWKVALRRLPMLGQNPLRYAMAAGGIALAAVIVFSLWGVQPAVVPGGTPSPSPPVTQAPTLTPTEAPAPSPGRTPKDTALNMNRPLEPGEWFIAGSFPVRVTYEVPSEGWVSFFHSNTAAGLATEDETVVVVFSIPNNVYADPCQAGGGLLSPPIGPTVDELVEALAGLSGPEVSGPVETSVAGYAAKQLTLTAGDAVEGCSEVDGVPAYSIWRTRAGAKHWITPGEINSIWILDVDGTRLAITTHVMPGAGASERADLDHIFESIRLEPRTAD